MLSTTKGVSNQDPQPRVLYKKMNLWVRSISIIKYREQKTTGVKQIFQRYGLQTCK